MREKDLCRAPEKDKYRDKRKRQVRHIEDSYREKGVSEEKAGEIAWSTVNKQDGDGKKSGAGHKRKKKIRLHEQ